MQFSNQGKRHPGCIRSILQATFHKLIFHEIALACICGQVAAHQLATIDRTMLPFKTADQFLSKGIAPLTAPHRPPPEFLT